MTKQPKQLEEGSVPVVDTVTQDDIDYDELKLICKQRDDWFFNKFSEHVGTNSLGRYIYIKHENAKVLAVAHIDTVVDPRKSFNFNIFHRNGVRIVKTPTLDDRLGVYTILKLLPSIYGNEWADILITEGEETGRSTAKQFKTDKEYNWIVEFDRNGSAMLEETDRGNKKGRYLVGNDAVLYDFGTDAKEFRAALVDAGFKNLGTGSFTDISAMQDLKVKGFNVGVGYHDNHSTKAYFFPVEYARSINLFMNFYNKYKDTKFPHKKVVKRTYYHKGHYDYNNNKKKNTAYRSATVYTPDSYVSEGWLLGALFKPGDLVEYTVINNHRVFIVDRAKVDKNDNYYYDLSYVTGEPYIQNLAESRIEKCLNRCMNCLMHTFAPLQAKDTDDTSITLCPQCYGYIIGERAQCDFCENLVGTDSLCEMGAGYIACKTCAEEIATYQKPQDNRSTYFLPGDIIRHKGGTKEYEVVSIDSGAQLFIFGQDSEGIERLFDNGGYGFDPSNFRLIMSGRRD
jgi:hypothetical protein